MDNKKEIKPIIKIPILLSIKLYLGLITTLTLFFSSYFVLYHFGGIYLLSVGFIPLVFTFLIPQRDGGLLITKKDHPKLFEVIEDVAKSLRTSLPKKVFLIPSSEISVSGLRDKKLTIGIAGLRSLTVGEFKSILAHEFGHLFGSDTVVSTLLWRLGESLRGAREFCYGLLEESKREPTLIVIAIVPIVFYNIYYYSFNLMYMAYSRQIEYRADYIASRVAGKENLYFGLSNYSYFTSYFNLLGYASLVKLLKENKQFQNIYKEVYQKYKQASPKKIKKCLNHSNRNKLFYSHPELSKRLKFICRTKPHKHSGEKATSLFRNFLVLEKIMTRAIAIRINSNLKLQVLHKEALQRNGRCKHCGLQFRWLYELLKHESSHKWVCECCGNQYRQLVLAEKCEAYCKKNKTLNLKITQYAIPQEKASV